MRWMSLILLLSAAATAAEKPNVVFLFADDQRADTIRAWGNQHIRTPNLDALVARGLSFRRAYCMGSIHGAVCVPSRAMVMSGRGLYKVPMDLHGVMTMPEWFRANGYDTFMTGKWHNGRDEYPRIFPDARAVFFGGMSDHTKVPLVDVSDGSIEKNRAAVGYSSEIFAETAVEFIEDYDETSPFFLHVAFTAPHDPRQPPEPYRSMYYEDPPPLPENFLPQHPFNTGYLEIRDEQLAAWPRTPDVIREQLAEYYGMITHLDVQVGRILTALRDAGLEDNTIVVYAADHGLAIGSHGLLGKQSLYEHSMRTPLVIAGPGVPEGASTDALVYLHDLFPTLSDLAGLDTPGNLDGSSLKPIIDGEQDRIRDFVYLGYEKHQRAIVENRWKLIQYARIGHEQLFDLMNDPNEMRNLADRGEHEARVARMLEQLRAAWQVANDPHPFETDEREPFAIVLTGRPREPDQWQPDWIVEKYFEVKQGETK